MIEADLDLFRCLIHLPGDLDEMERMEREVELLRDLDGSRGESHPPELPVDGRRSGWGDLLFPRGRGNMLVTVERLKRGRRYGEEPREGGGSVDMTSSDISMRYQWDASTGAVASGGMAAVECAKYEGRC